MAEARLQERLTASDLFLLLWDDDGWRMFDDRVWLPRAVRHCVWTAQPE